MKKILIALVCAVVSLGASAQGKLTVNAGFLFPSTLNATVGYEHSFTYGNAVEVFGEIGNHWKSGEGQFERLLLGWRHTLQASSRPLQNGMLRFRFGPEFGATERKFFLGIEGGFEYNYVFQNGWEFSLIRKTMSISSMAIRSGTVC